MTKPIKKGSLPDYIGGQPPSPRDLGHKGPMHDERQCRPSDTALCFGHQLRRSGCFPALPYPPNWHEDSIKIDQSYKLAIIENQKKEGENNFKNWRTIDRKLHPKLTLKS